MKTIEKAEYLVLLGDGATVLCQRHKDALVAAFAAAGQQLDVFPVPEQDEQGQPTDDMSCQA